MRNKGKFPKNINVPITEEMNDEILKIIDRLQILSPGITKSGWCRVVIQRELLRNKSKRKKA